MPFSTLPAIIKNNSQLQLILTSTANNWPLLLSTATFSSISIYLLSQNKILARKCSTPYKQRDSRINTSESSSGKTTKSLVNILFFKKLFRLIKIVIPSVNCNEFRLLLLFSMFLLARTFLSIKISEYNGLIVKAIVSADKVHFVKNLSKLAMSSLPASVVNSMLRFLVSKLSFAFRRRLFHHFNELYFKPKMIYKVINIDSRVPNPDQILTQTITEWSHELAALYSNLTKPFLDILLFSKKLTDLLGYQGPLLAMAYYSLSAIAFKLFSPSFGRLTARALELEGVFKRYHGRLLNFSEEIAFLDGNDREKKLLNNAFSDIEYQRCYVIDKDYYTGLFRGFISKYGSFLTAYFVLGLPVFKKGSDAYLEKTSENRSIIVGDYIRNSNLYINLSLAIGKVVVSYSSLQKLSGYTLLIMKLQRVLCDLDQGKFVREFASNNNYYNGNNNEEFELQLIQKNGKIYTDYSKWNINSENTSIRLHDLDITTPNGDCLARNINLEISDKMNVLITGPNGCGKSSLFRILSQLWPIFKGSIDMPRESSFFYIPQKPYLTNGSLLRQILYPKDPTNLENNPLTVERARKVLDIVNLGHLYKEAEGLAQVRDWGEELSGGEKQQVALARLLFHEPKFAIMDECTSAVAYDLEELIYSKCKERGINLITISHRKSLWKFHEFLLEFDGRGGWEFGVMKEEYYL